MSTVRLTINGQPCEAEAGMTILDAARSIGIKIPTLCYLREINEIGACRVCVVEVKGARTLVASCVYPVSEGMEVFTNTERVLKSRKMTVELLLSNHDKKCLSCVRSGNCELQELSRQLGCDDQKYKGKVQRFALDASTPYLIRDNNKCILCRRCVAACEKVQGIGVIGANGRGFDTEIGSYFLKNLSEVNCVGCGQCIAVCPTGALREKSEGDEVLRALQNPQKYVVFGTAPSVRVGLGEEFGFADGTDVEGKMVASIRRLGADAVFDVDFAADLTVMEEGYEFLNRLQNEGVLPMMTSCSPAWIKFVEHNYPALIPNLSTCKSPQQMFGATVKTYYAEKTGRKPEDVVVVSVMPCTAKKFEKERKNQAAAGVPDVDYVLTTRELAALLRKQGILFASLPDESFDAPLGISTGAGVLFGVSGGVMEAALRTVSEVIEGKPTPIVFSEVRGTEGIREADFAFAGKKVKVAVASSLSKAKILCEEIKNGNSRYAFIEIMSCPGGCVNGGGQPIKTADERNFGSFVVDRTESVLKNDERSTLRKSHENPVVQELYASYFGSPNSEKAHEVLHTTYEQRPKY